MQLDPSLVPWACSVETVRVITENCYSKGKVELVVSGLPEPLHYDIGTGNQPSGIYYNMQLGEYTLVVTDGCDWQREWMIRIPEYRYGIEPYVPNVFTPNGDSKNEVFRPLGLKQGEYDMRIYNRWGNEVFKNSNAAGGWNGSITSQDAQEGTYYYTIKFYDSCQSKEKTLSGSFTLVR